MYNRSHSDRVKQLEAKGATLAESPSAVAWKSDLVFHMVGHPSDVEEVLLGQDGTLAGLRPGGVAIDMTTSSPSLAVRIADAAHTTGAVSIDAPVTGGDIGAQNGTLSILLGGDEAACRNLTPFLLETIAGTANYFGGAGQGQQAKLANQIGISTQIVAMAESMLFAHKAGLDLATWLPAVANGGMGSFSVSNYAPRVMERNFDPGFYVTHFIKDLGLALDECKRMKITLPGLELAHQLFVLLKNQGHGDKGIHALVLALEQINGGVGAGMTLPKRTVALPPTPTPAAKAPKRVINLSAGPSALPTSVMLEAQSKFVDHDGAGIGMLEMSHRDPGGTFQNTLQYATDATRDLLSVPDDYHVLWFQGGAHGQFAASIQNLVSPGGQVDVVQTGYWSERFKSTEADRLTGGKVNVAWSGDHGTAAGEGYKRIAHESEWNWSPDSEMMHICHNETIHGTEFHSDPTLPAGAPTLCADATSNLLSRPVDVSKYGLIYASSGKNLPAAGATCVIVRDDLLGKARDECPSVLNYTKQAATMPISSLYNTPPTYNLYMISLMLKEYERMGGIDILEARAIRRAGVIYDAVDSTGGFYRNSVDSSCRSRMNVPFRICTESGEPHAALEAKFIEDAAAEGIEQLFLHPLFPGLRVTMYNALPDDAVTKVAEYMYTFFERNHALGQDQDYERVASQ